MVYGEENLYYHPEKSGLKQIASLEFSDGCYVFDTRIVWQRIKDGQLLSARDSGCSCPTPFETVRLEDLQEVNNLGWLKDEILESLDRRNKYGGGNSDLEQESRGFLDTVEKALKGKENV